MPRSKRGSHHMQASSSEVSSKEESPTQPSEEYGNNINNNPFIFVPEPAIETTVLETETVVSETMTELVLEKIQGETTTITKPEVEEVTAPATETATTEGQTTTMLGVGLETTQEVTIETTEEVATETAALITITTFPASLEESLATETTTSAQTTAEIIIPTNHDEVEETSNIVMFNDSILPDVPLPSTPKNEDFFEESTVSNNDPEIPVLFRTQGNMQTSTSYVTTMDNNNVTSLWDQDRQEETGMSSNETLTEAYILKTKDVADEHTTTSVAEEIQHVDLIMVVNEETPIMEEGKEKVDTHEKESETLNFSCRHGPSCEKHKRRQQRRMLRKQQQQQVENSGETIATNDGVFITSSSTQPLESDNNNNSKAPFAKQSEENKSILQLAINPMDLSVSCGVGGAPPEENEEANPPSSDQEAKPPSYNQEVEIATVPEEINGKIVSDDGVHEDAEIVPPLVDIHITSQEPSLNSIRYRNTQHRQHTHQSFADVLRKQQHNDDSGAAKNISSVSPSKPAKQVSFATMSSSSSTSSSPTNTLIPETKSPVAIKAYEIDQRTTEDGFYQKLIIRVNRIDVTSDDVIAFCGEYRTKLEKAQNRSILVYYIAVTIDIPTILGLMSAMVTHFKELHLLLEQKLLAYAALIPYQKISTAVQAVLRQFPTQVSGLISAKDLDCKTFLKDIHHRVLMGHEYLIGQPITVNNNNNNTSTSTSTTSSATTTAVTSQKTTKK